MIYILEGPDGGGKSTHAKMLSMVTGFPVKHFSNPKSEEEKAKMFEMYVETLVDSDDVIFDRSWYSDMVYGPILRGKATISESQCSVLERLAALKGVEVIYMHGDVDRLAARAFSRGEDLIMREQFPRIVQAYQELFENRHVVRYTLDGN